MINEELVLDTIKEVNYPRLNKDLVSLGFVKKVEIRDKGVKVHLTLPLPNCPLRGKIVEEVHKVLKALDVGKIELKVESSIPTSPLVHTKGTRKVKNIIAVGSGKGGVGKSTVAVQLALALRKFGARVGVLDADIYGASIPLMLGINAMPEVQEEMIKPVEVHEVKIISVGFFVPKNSAVIWRGPLVSKAIKDFLDLVDWGELDYLIVDLPPGTGDAPLTLAQTVSLTGMVIVSTPQKAALEVAIKAYHMFKKLDAPILGFIENMSYLICPHCGNRIDLFKTGSVEHIAKEFGVPFLGKVPIDPKLPELEDSGLPAIGLSDVGDEFLRIAENLALEVSIVALTAEKDEGRPNFFLDLSKK